MRPAFLFVLFVTPLARGDEWFSKQSPALLALYQQLHSHPELSFHEAETSKRIAEELRQAGAEVTAGVGKFGVVGVLKNGEGPVVLVRSDLDALPVVEDTGLPFASKVTTTDDEGKSVGVMHACGHDVHMTCLVGTARWLADHKDMWKGTVVLIGQPAEEKIGGAKAMLDDGLYSRFPKPELRPGPPRRPRPRRRQARLHPRPRDGQLDLDRHPRPRQGGPRRHAEQHGRPDRPGGRAGARPPDDRQPRDQPCLHPFGLGHQSARSHGGSKHNIIPSEVRLQLTIRSYKPEVRSQILEAIHRKAKALALAHRAPEPEVVVSDDTPPTINTPRRVDRVVPALKKAVGEGNVTEVEPTMGAEDFGLFSTGGVPIFMFRLGARPAGRRPRPRSRGRDPPLAPLGRLHARRPAEHRDGRQGHDRRGRRPPPEVKWEEDHPQMTQIYAE